MSLVLKAVLAFLLALAVPVQGLAAATMLHCGPSHHRQAVVQASAHNHAAHDHSAHAHAGHHVDCGAAQAASPHAAESAPGGLDDPLQAKCSACANCCSSAAIPTTAVSLAEPQAEALGFLDTPPGFALVDLTGLKRPPRLFLA